MNPDEMSDDEMRVKIAELCGWTVEKFGASKEFPNGVNLGFKTDDEEEQGQILPDYLNDLNAMHEAEKTLTNDEYETYEDRIWFTREYLSATARQRAIAFLKTKLV